MKLNLRKSILTGRVSIPASKSHTIRAAAIASLADGASVLREPLVAADTLSAVSAFQLLGADIETGVDWHINGVAGKPKVPENVLDVGNSGTTLYVAMAAAALLNGTSVLTGDSQIRRRPAGPLMNALSSLGASVHSTRGGGLVPVVVEGPICGGSIELDCSKTSQYLTSLLLACPLCELDTTIEAHHLVEKPYVEMTLDWLYREGVRVEYESLRRFHIPGGQSYKAFDRRIPADFSSATFFMCAAAVTGGEVTLTGLDPDDTQGDKAVVDMLGEMGADFEWAGNELTVRGGSLKGAVLDLGDTPDALPALAVTACFAEGETKLINVAQARLKETDRISVMLQELSKLGAYLQETPDGLIIRGAKLHSAELAGHGDHRVVMALAISGMAIDGNTTIDSAEAMDVTFPSFVELMRSIGGDIERV